MLGDTPAQVSRQLGYSGRMTVNRILNETAGTAAIAEFCNRLEAEFGLGSEQIITFAWFLDACKDLEKLLDTLGVSPESGIDALIQGDFQIFEQLSGSSELYRLKQMRKYDCHSLSGVLSFMFFRKLGESIDDLKAWLAERYSDNAFGWYVGALSGYSPLAYSKYPQRLKDIDLGASIIKSYFSGSGVEESLKKMKPLPGIVGRSYWKDDSGNNILLLPVTLGDGDAVYYEVFYVNDRKEIENLAQLIYGGEDYVCFIIKNEKKTTWAKIKFDSDKISLDWTESGGGFTEMRRLDIGKSSYLSSLDGSITHDSLLSIIRHASGIEEIGGISISDISVSRNQIVIHLSDGNRLSIDKTSHDFLNTVTPDMELLLYRDLENNKVYIEWTQLARRVALTEFKRFSDAD